MAQITIDRLKDNMAFKKIPILTLDERWYQLIPDKDKSDEIKNLEKNLNDLLKKQGQVNTDLKEVKKIKSRLIQDVVDNMEDENVPDVNHQKKMSQNQRLIQEAKEKIGSLEDESLEVPRFLQEANQQLMVATVNYCYKKLNVNKDDIALLEKWISETRIKLKKNLLIKQDKEIKNQQVYSFMHDSLGAEMMGILDKINEQ